MFTTQHFAFHAVQIRIATALYPLSYVFPFLILPIGLANGLSNFLMGGLGAPDVIGGFIAGIIVSGAAYLVRRFKLPMFLLIPIVVFGSGLIVPIWLAPLIGWPYFALAINISLGQIPSAITGYLLIKALDQHADKIGLDK